MANESRSLWIGVLLAFVIVAGLWYYSTQLQPDPPGRGPAPTQQPESEPAQPTGPLHPLPEPAGTERPDVRPLPDLADSDEFLKLELSDLYGSEISSLLAESRVIERIVATVDNLPRGHVAERTRPVSSLSEAFVAEPTDTAGQYVLSPAGYARYDGLVQLATQVDTDSLVNLYQRYYPLFQKAYVDLGYPDGYFNDRLVEVIDHLQATPNVETPIFLQRSHVLYEFADPDLEVLSSGQKLMIRMGPENADAIKTKLADLRAAIVSNEAE